jgi:hypothetical protein
MQTSTLIRVGFVFLLLLVMCDVLLIAAAGISWKTLLFSLITAIAAVAWWLRWQHDSRR